MVHFPPQDPASPLPRIVVRGSLTFYAAHWLEEGCAIIPIGGGEIPRSTTDDDQPSHALDRH